MTHRRFLLFGLLLLAELAAAQTPRYNVLFIAVDDLRPELGCYGAAHIHSPNIDRLARRGVVFTRAFCQQALCSPSRSSLLTGLRPDSCGIHDLNRHFRETVPDVVTLPQHFKNHGYHTAFWGKIYHAWLLDKPSWSEGGDDQLRRLEPQHPRENWRAYVLPESIRAANANGGTGPVIEKADLPDNAYPDGKVADSAVTTLRRFATLRQPFFLAVGFYKPHVPWTAPEKYWQPYPLDRVGPPLHDHEPVDGSRFGFTGLANFGQYTDVEDQRRLTATTTQRLRQAYFANVSYADAQIGKVLDELDRQGLTKNTLVVLWGDHGFKLGDYGAWEKSTNTELDTRVPLIVSSPALPSGGRQASTLAELLDVYPTLCDLAGLPKPAHLQGTSLVGALRDPAAHVKNVVFSQYPKRSQNQTATGYALRDERYRLILWLGTDDPRRPVLDVDLFDHQTDPHEERSIARDLSPAGFREAARSILEKADYRVNGYRRETEILDKLMAWKGREK